MSRELRQEARGKRQEDIYLKLAKKLRYEIKRLRNWEIVWKLKIDNSKIIPAFSSIYSHFKLKFTLNLIG